MTRPYIVVMASASLDGRVALGPNRTQWEEMSDPRSQVSGEDTSMWSEVEREIDRIYAPQAKMQGSGSFIKEGEELQLLPACENRVETLYQDFLPHEIVYRPDHKMWLIAVDGRGRMRSGYKGTETPGNHMLHLTCRAAPPEYLAFLRHTGIPYLIAGEHRVDLPAVMEKLKAKLRVNCLVSMAGGKLNGALLRAGLVDEVNLILRPQLIGGTQTPSLFDSPDLQPDEWPAPLGLILAQVRANGFLWLRYRVLRGERPV